MPLPIPIKAIGRYFPQDSEGYIQNDTSWEYLSKPWQSVAQEILVSYQQELGLDLHSVYLRGSLARGTQVDGFSDIDTFALVHRPNLRWVKGAWQSTLETRLQNTFHLVKEVEIMLSSFDENMKKKYPALAMQIKTQSLCLYGPDYGQLLSPYRPSKSMMIYYQWLDTDLKAFLAKEKINKKDCQALMKGMIRSGFELVMIREGRFTTDLYFCYQTFGKYYPDYEPNMKEALYFYLNPIDDKKRLVSKIYSFGNWLVTEINKELLT